MMPRIQARIGTVETPEKHKGKFCFEVILSIMGQGEGRSLGDWGPFDTEQQAKESMREVVERISKVIEKQMTGKVTGDYLDLKTNQIRPWTVQ